MGGRHLTSSYALLFPGQASQQVGMGGDFRRTSCGAIIFELAERATGLPLSQIIDEGPLERLTETRCAQTGVVATSLAALEELRRELENRSLPPPAYCAGHSVGELAALAAAGALTTTEALELVARRSALMAQACEQVDGTMAAVVGIAPELLASLCVEASRATGESVEIANFNAPDQLVVSGHRLAVSCLQQKAAEAGARRVLPLKVAGPFHSRYMRQASEGFATALKTVPLRVPLVPIVLNQTAAPTVDPEEIRRELGEQIASPVRWTESLQALYQAGCGLFVEVGPGRVLAGLVRRSMPAARCVSVQDAASLESTLDALADVGR